MTNFDVITSIIKTVNMMKYENEYHEILKRLSQLISTKRRYLLSSIKLRLFQYTRIFFGVSY